MVTQEELASMSPDEIREMQKQQCPFCHIVAGKIPARKIYEDDKVLAVLDINPAAQGHILLMPKEHYAIMPFVPDDVLAHLARIAKSISKAILKCLLVKGTNIFIANGAIAGQQAPHFLIHLIPREDGDGIEVFTLSETTLGPEIEQDLPAISQQLYARMHDFAAQHPSGKTIPEVPKPTEEQLLQLVEQNQQLKEIITKQPAQFKQLAAAHPQLMPLFKGVDLEVFISKVLGNNTNKKVPAKEDIDLDAVSRFVEYAPTPSPAKEEQAKAEDKKKASPHEKKEGKPKKKNETLEKEDIDLDKVIGLLGGA